jgi:hypothetical protein
VQTGFKPARRAETQGALDVRPDPRAFAADHGLNAVDDLQIDRTRGH